MPVILDRAKFGLMWVFVTLRGRAVAMLVAPSLPPPSAGGEVVENSWNFSVFSGGLA